MSRPAKKRAINKGESSRASETPSDIRINYLGCYFPIEISVEGKIFLRLNGMEMNPPMYFNWGLIESLEVKARLTRYLDVLGLRMFASMQRDGYDQLCLEMISTFSMEYADIVECQLGGKRVKVTRNLMYTLFGFTKDEDVYRKVPTSLAEFNPNEG